MIAITGRGTADFRVVIRNFLYRLRVSAGQKRLLSSLPPNPRFPTPPQKKETTTTTKPEPTSIRETAINS